MAKYLVQGNYVGAGVKGLLKDGGTGRREAVKKLVESVGGKLESIYYAFGYTDIYCIIDLPDHIAAAGLALTVGATETVDLKTTVLLTPEEIDQAVKKKVEYTPPGQ